MERTRRWLRTSFIITTVHPRLHLQGVSYLMWSGVLRDSLTPCGADMEIIQHSSSCEHHWQVAQSNYINLISIVPLQFFVFLTFCPYLIPLVGARFFRACVISTFSLCAFTIARVYGYFLILPCTTNLSYPHRSFSTYQFILHLFVIVVYHYRASVQSSTSLMLVDLCHTLVCSLLSHLCTRATEVAVELII